MVGQIEGVLIKGRSKMELEYVVKREIPEEPTAKVLKGHSYMSVPCVSLAGPDVSVSILKPYDEFKKPEGDGYFRLSIWENGGAQASAGEAEVVCSLNGEALTPKFIKRKVGVGGSLACGTHALFVGDGLVVVKASHYRKDFSIEITEYVITNQDDGSTRVKVLWKINVGLVINPDEFIKDLPVPYKDFGLAIKAAMEKAQHLHCREPHYFVEPEAKYGEDEAVPETK